MTRRGRWIGAILALALLSASCSSTATGGLGRSDGTATGGATSIPRAKISFREVDAAMTKRVNDFGLPGAADLVVRDGTIRHDQTYGSYNRSTKVPIASASKWLTSALLLTLVDENLLALDAPVSTYLPEWSGNKQAITLRLLLSHHAGIPGSAGCLGDSQMTLRDCANDIATKPLDYPVGTEFHYGNAGYTVAAAAAEAVTNKDFTTLFRERITSPIGMPDTTFPEGRSGPPSANPLTAAGAVSTLDDYAKFVTVMAALGVTPDGRRILSEASVREIEKDQVKGLDTRADFAVQITNFPTYGLGVWRDRSAATDETQMISGSGSVGFYPWIDRERHAYGVLLVNDGAGGGGRAVRESSRIVHDLILPALDNS